MKTEYYYGMHVSQTCARKVHKSRNARNMCRSLFLKRAPIRSYEKETGMLTNKTRWGGGEEWTENGIGRSEYRMIRKEIIDTLCEFRGRTQEYTLVNKWEKFILPLSIKHLAITKSRKFIYHLIPTACNLERK